MKYILVLLSIIFFIILKIMKKKRKIRNLFIIDALLISLFLELTIFNIKSYSTDFSKLNIKEYDISTCINEDEKENHEKDYIIKDDSITIYNIDDKVKTIYLKLDNVPENSGVEYAISYSDSSTEESSFRSKLYIEGIDNSKYTSVYFSGNLKTLKISFNTNDKIKIDKIILNEDIPLEFNIIRYLVITIILCICYSIKNHKLWNIPFKMTDKNQKIIEYLTIMLVILLISYCNKINNFEYYSDLYNVKFVDAICKGSASLLEKPSDKLLALENPYDFVQRTSLRRNIDYIFDAALYNGKYYVYYGILPALILYVPFHLIFGTYLSNAIGVLIFSLLSIFILSLIYKYIYKKYFSNLPFKIYISLLFILLFGSGFVFLNDLPRFYELMSASALFFSILGIYFVLISDKNKKINYKYVLSGIICLALSFMCRPTQLFAFLIVIPRLLKYLKQEIKENKKNVIKLVLIVIIPYLLVGVFQMYYNYIRFDNPFDFGTKYQLTINNMKDSKTQIYSLINGLICNLFNLPEINSEFPYIQKNANYLENYSFYYIEEMIAGLFFFFFFCFEIFEFKKYFKNEKNKDLKYFSLMLLLDAIILAILNVLNGGSTPRYLLDYGWMFILLGCIIFTRKYVNLKDNKAEKIYDRFICILLVYTFIINFLSIYALGRVGLDFYKTKYMVEFWK